MNKQTFISILVATISSIVTTVALPVLDFYFNWYAKIFEKENRCWVVAKEIISDAPKYIKNRDNISIFVSLIPASCSHQKDALLALVGSFISEGIDSNPGNQAAPILPPPTNESSNVSKTNNWVAVGWINDASDMHNFTLKGGLAELKAGADICAKWSVNVRNKPAGWDQVKSVVKQGDCRKVLNVTNIQALDRKQVWAEIL